MEHEKLPMSWNFVLGHGILPILPLDFTKLVTFFSDFKKFSKNLESQHFHTFSNLFRKMSRMKI